MEEKVNANELPKVTPEESIKTLMAERDKYLNLAQRYEQQLRAIDYTAMRLNYLFKVIDSPNSALFHAEFLEACAKEIQGLITIPEQSQDASNEVPVEAEKGE